MAYHLITSSYHHVTMSSDHAIIRYSCHHIVISLRIVISSYRHIITSSRQHVMISSYLHVIGPPYHHLSTTVRAYHHHVITSWNNHIPAPSYRHITTRSHHHITISSYHPELSAKRGRLGGSSSWAHWSAQTVHCKPVRWRRRLPDQTTHPYPYPLGSDWLSWSALGYLRASSWLFWKLGTQMCRITQQHLVVCDILAGSMVLSSPAAVVARSAVSIHTFTPPRFSMMRVSQTLFSRA